MIAIFTKGDQILIVGLGANGDPIDKDRTVHFYCKMWLPIG